MNGSIKDHIKGPSTAAVEWGIRTAGALAALIGGIYLAAWLSGTAARWSASGVITVKTNTAVALLMAGLALLLLAPGPNSGFRRWIGTLFSALILIIGALTLSQHLFGWNLGIDQIIATEPPGAVATASPNRMGPPASLCNVLLGTALLAMAFGRRWIVPYIGIVISVINLVPMVGFLYGIETFYTKPHLTHIAWPTVVALLSLGIGLIMSRTDGGPMATLLRDDAGGMLLRKLLPVTLLIPLALGFLKMEAEHIGYRDTSIRTGILVITLSLVFSAMLWRSAAHLSRAAAAQKRAREDLQEANEHLKAVNERLATTNKELQATTQNLHDEITERKRAEQALREAEAHKREFYQRTIMAATDGKLVIVEKQDIDQIACEPVRTWDVKNSSSFATMRAEVTELALELGMEEPEVYQFLGCVVEAATNATKHADGGEASLCRTQDSLIFVISDTGPGIGALAIPDVALTRHYSTAGTLGMGYKLMIKFADRVYLCTGSEGTTVAVEMMLK